MGCRNWKAATPAGLVVEAVDVGPDRIVITAQPAEAMGICPDCGFQSSQIHSRYERQLMDLPSHGRSVRLRVRVRRFRCSDGRCPRRTFSERLGDKVAAVAARRTSRLEEIVHCLGITLGGRPAVDLASRLMLPVSKDTLLRSVRRREPLTVDPPRVIGIDDWAWRRNQRYGTIICDLERRCVVDLLPDREVGTVESWLASHPEISIIARDRAGGYAQAASAAAPDAVQVADRWHLMENASAAFLEAVRRSMRAIRQALGCASVDPALLTAAEGLQYEGHLRRKAEAEEIRAMADAGTPIKAIVRKTGRSRKLIRAVVRGAMDEVFRPRASTLTAHLPWLDAAWSDGCRNGAELWRRLRADGFRGSLRVVTEWTTRRRRSEQAGTGRIRKPPSARGIARLMLGPPGQMSREEALMVAAAERAVPNLTVARGLVDRFHAMMRGNSPECLSAWINDASTGMLASLGRGIASDQAAVAAAIVSQWSNGQAEGKITKLKLLRRQMYGRGSLSLLRARLLGAEQLRLVHGK